MSRWIPWLMLTVALTAEAGKPVTPRPTAPAPAPTAPAPASTAGDSQTTCQAFAA